MTRTKAAVAAVLTLALGVVAWVLRPNDRIAPTAALGALAAAALLTVGAARGWYSYPRRPGEPGSLWLAVPGPFAAIVAGQLTGDRDPLVFAALALDVGVLALLLACTWLRRRNGGMEL